eukprot:2702754-Alexandrium_andersonii.AAC.1
MPGQPGGPASPQPVQRTGRADRALQPPPGGCGQGSASAPAFVHPSAPGTSARHCAFQRPSRCTILACPEAT